MLSEVSSNSQDNPYNKFAWVLGKPEIGERVWIGAFTLIDSLHNKLIIGKGTDISSGVQILTHSTVRRAISERRFGEIDSAPTEVGEYCFIGTHATILMGASIGHHSVVAAGAVVPQYTKIPPYSIVAGIPATIIGSSKRLLKNIEKESISITIPAFNEEKNIEDVVKEAVREVSKITKDYEILLVDDGSKDKTGAIIKDLARKNRKIKAIFHKKNKGFTGAIKSCLNNAKKHLVFLAPADGQFDFSQLNSFVDAIRGYDMAIAYKVSTNEGIYRKFSSWAIYKLYQTLFKVPIKEISSVFMWRRRVIESIQIESENRGSMFLYEFFFKAIQKKYKYIEVPISWNMRRSGKSKGRDFKNIFKTLLGMIDFWYKHILLPAI